PHWHGERQWAPGELAEHWTAPLPFHPNSIVARKSAIQACGGWPALPANEDLLVALLLSERSFGASVPEVLTHYRTWQNQEVADGNYSKLKNISFSVIEGIVNASRHGQGRLPITRPEAGGAYGVVPSIII
ncbi:MAG: hypothetical protein ACRC0L_12935, partial [Angustibacter sp.]